jgi:hypothetical protein
VNITDVHIRKNERSSELIECTVNVKIRDRVAWTNNDPVIHTIIEGSLIASFNYNLRSNKYEDGV